MTSFDQQAVRIDDTAVRGAAGQLATARPGRISGRERLILAVLLTAGFTLAVDFSVLSVALPTIGADVSWRQASRRGPSWAACSPTC
jgi:hypothetical protein